MNNKLKLEDKINHGLNEIVQAKWEQVMNETGVSKLDMPKEYFAVIRVLFQLGYQEGQTDTMDQMKDIYENDIDLFEEMFADEEVAS